MTDTVDYRIDPPLDDANLNDLFARAWPDHSPRAFQPVLSRSLGTLAAFVGISNIATPPADRRRGYGAAVTARAVTDGLAAGARLVLAAIQRGWIPGL